MRKVLFFEEAEANKLPITANGMVVGRKNIDAWHDIHQYLTDVDGNKYLICHGTKEGYLVYSGIAVNEAYQIYRKAVKDGFIKRGEHLSIICCHGAAVQEMTESKRQYVMDIWDDWSESDYNFSFFNETYEAARVQKTRLQNGKYRVAVWTEENKISTIIYKIRNAF